jgi:hypothetical protein
MLFEYDLSSAPVLRPVDDGIYLFRVISSKERMTDKQKQEIMWELQIEEPKEVIVDGAKVETLYIPMYFDPTDAKKAMGFIRDFFDACGKLIPGAKTFDTQDVYGALVGGEITKQPGTPEFPNPKNQCRKWFKQGEMPPVGLKPQN